MPDKHATLSASSAHRRLACPPSAKLNAAASDIGSEYAAQGTDAHSLCEFKVLKYLDNTEIAAILSKAYELIFWASDVKEYALQQALNGEEFDGFKVAEDKALIKFFCVPYSFEDSRPLFHEPADYPEKWELFKLAKILKLRQQLAESSVKKYQPMNNAICTDNRARGMFSFYGASRTRREAGSIIQLQNLPQNHIPDLTQAREIVKYGYFDEVEMLYDDVPDTLLQLRQKGKIAELALGYGGMVYLTACKECWVFSSHISAGMKKEIEKAKQMDKIVRYFTEKHDGKLTIDCVICLQSDTSADKQQTASKQIPQGQRNSTLSRFAGRSVKRYGATDRAREIFIEESAKCSPPLPDDELRLIWNSACKFAKKVQSQKGYIPPEEYEFGGSLKPSDYSDIGQAKVIAGE